MHVHSGRAVTKGSQPTHLQQGRRSLIYTRHPLDGTCLPHHLLVKAITSKHYQEAPARVDGKRVATEPVTDLIRLPSLRSAELTFPYRGCAASWNGKNAAARMFRLNRRPLSKSGPKSRTEKDRLPVTGEEAAVEVPMRVPLRAPQPASRLTLAENHRPQDRGM